MAQDVWLLRRALISCLLLSVFAGNAKGTNKSLSSAELLVPVIKHHANHTFSSAVKNYFVRNGSSETEHKNKLGNKDAAHNKPATIRRKNIRSKSMLLAERSTKRNVVSGNEETGANRTRIRALDSFFVNPEIIAEPPTEENGPTQSKETFLSALSLDGLYHGGLNTEMALQNDESELPSTQTLDREVSRQFLDWSRKSLGNDKLGQERIEMDGLGIYPVTSNVKKYWENSVEGRKIVHAASLVESSLESQGTGLNEPVKYPGEKVGNRARAFQYFLPIHSPINVKPHSRYRYVNSLIKPQLAGISADLNGLDARRDRSKSASLKNGFASGESMAQTQPKEVQTGTIDAGLETSKMKQEEEEESHDNTEVKLRVPNNADDTFMLGSPYRPTFLQELFLANPKAILISSGSGDEKYGYGKFKMPHSVAGPTLRWQTYTGAVTSNESKFPEELIHSAEEINSEGQPVASKAGKMLRASVQVLLQPLKNKSLSHIEEESNDFNDEHTEGSSEVLASGQGSPEAHRMSPSPDHSYFRPTKVQGFPKATTLSSYKRTTIPNRRYNSKFKSWASSSGEDSGSGEISVPPREHHHKVKPTRKISTGGSLSKAKNTHTGIIGIKDKETTRKCKKMGKSDYRERCPHGWLSFDEFCYLFVSHSMGKWEEFPQKCNKENALLAMPKTVKELKFLQNKIHMVRCNEPKAGYVCELRTGVKALSILAFGDSLTNGFHGDDKSRTPYAKTLEVLLNKDKHRCYTLTTVAKDGTEAAEMSALLQSYLKKTKFKCSWVIILAGTNDIVHNSHAQNRKAWDTVVEHIIDLHITSHRFGAKTMTVTIPEMDCEESDRPPCQHTRLEREYINEKLRHYARTNDFTILCDLATKLPRYSLSNEERNRMWEEGLHMKRAGYERMAEIIYQDLLSHIDDVEN